MMTSEEVVAKLNQDLSIYEIDTKEDLASVLTNSLGIPSDTFKMSVNPFNRKIKVDINAGDGHNVQINMNLKKKNFKVEFQKLF